MKPLIAIGVFFLGFSSAAADDLFSNSRWPYLASDRSAARVGDVLTIVVYQAAEARNSAQNGARKQFSLSGAVRGGALRESGEAALAGGYNGSGEVRREESFTTQVSVTVTDILANGDLKIAGEQDMFVNGEKTRVAVRGRVRPVDIGADNRVLSSRIADAEISYNGHGFVSRNARPGFVQRLFGLLGFGGG